MVDTYSFDSLLNTTAGMTAIVNNTKHDDDTVSVTGVDWFTYAGKTASKIYVSGNNWVGFGQSAEQLKICRRDGAVYYIYRQEGVLKSGKKFLKIRVEGYTYYSNTGTAYAIKYEIFLIEGQTLFINVVQRPTNSSYIGTSSITDGSTTTTLTITTSTAVPIYILVKNAGSAQEVSYEKFVDTVITGITVTTLPSKTTYYKNEPFDSTGMIVTASYSDGTSKELTNYTLSGFDSGNAGTKTITVTVGTVTTTFDITVLDETLTGITITTLPAKANYHIGATFDSSGIVAVINTSGGNTVDLDSSKLEYSGFDSSSPGSNTITVAYNGMTATFDVTIMTPTSIQAQGYSVTAYFVGDTSDVRVSYINATYSDGITDSNIKSGYTIAQVDTSTTGKKTAIVDYFGVTAEIPVYVLGSYSVQAGTPNLEDVTITFDLDTGVMNIMGTGEFLNFYSIENTPSSIQSRIRILNIGAGITSIPDYDFTNVPNIEEVSFPDTLEKIGGSGNFSSCKISELHFPSSLKRIGSSCFNSLENLQEVTFSEGLEAIDYSCFNGCKLLKNLVFPSSLKKMSYSFQSIELENLEIGGESVSFSSGGISDIYAKNMIIRGGTISSGILSGKNIETLTLGETVKWNSASQFSGCSKLTTVSIANGITSIPPSCFNGCSSLDNVVLPDSIMEIGENVFLGCSSLKTITLSKNIKKIPNNCFASCGFETFTIPNDSAIEELGNAIFQGCPDLKTVYIGENVKTIGGGGFFGANSLTSIRINQKENAISGAPWASSTATVEWLVKPVKIELTSLPAKLKYKNGESFESTGLIVNAIYDDGTEQETTSYTLSTPDMSTAGTKTITVTSQGQTATFDILVVAISGIEITSLPNKLEYLKGTVLDTTGLVISTVWTDGTKETISDYSLSGFDSEETGTKTITVTYQTFTATFTVEVVADTAGIRIASYPNKVYYKIGESLDTTGLTVVKYRADGTEVEITGYTVSELDSSTAGSKTITVNYTEDVSADEVAVYDTDFQVRVTKDGTNPFADNTDPINVTVHWINGEFEDLTNENIDQNTLTLQESICSESYFIFGGCVCNQITFQAHHEQFNGTDEEFYPTGKIEVYLECKGTSVKIFTGEIDSAERKANSLTRNFVAYDYLYKLRNTDIAWWYKNQTTDKNKLLTQKQFRDKLFEFLGIEQVETKLHWDDTYVPNTNNSNEMNVVNILKDLCLQNDRFGWMNRDGKFEYLKLRQNSYEYGETVAGKKIYRYYNNEEVHLDNFKSFQAKEGKIWFPNVIFCDPEPNRAYGFIQGDYTAQEAYDNNVYYNRNSFFVGNEDWMDYVWNADEYGGISRSEPIIKICYGVFINKDLRKYYRAQGYTVEVEGNPFNTVGQGVELYYVKQIQHDDQEPTELQWYVHSYIMSRTLKLGITGLIDTYSANNAPFNSNSQQLGKYTPEISATVNKTRSELPTISYEEFTDGSDFSTQAAGDFSDGLDATGTVKKAQLRCMKRIKKSDYDALVAAGTDRKDTLYFTYEED